MVRILKVLVCTGVFVLLAMGLAQGHSIWAKYQTTPVTPDVNVPAKYLNPNGTINCCGCHGTHPGIPRLFCK